MATTNTKETKETKSAPDNNLTISTPSVKQSEVVYPYQKSRIIVIKRKSTDPVLPEEGMNYNSAEDYHKLLGPHMDGYGSSQLLGRTLFDYVDNAFEEEKRIMSRVINVDPKDTKWEKSLNDYWHNLYIRIPIRGKELEMGKRFLAEGVWEPINYTDFVAALYALKCVEVANDPKVMHKSKRIKFYIFNAEAEKQKKLDLLDIEDKAYMLNKKIEGDLSKINAVLRLAEKPVSRNMTDARLALNEFRREDPAEFYNIANDHLLLQKYFVEEAIQMGFLTRPVNSTIIIYDGVTIGHNLEQAVAFLNDTVNKEIKAILEAKVRLIGDKD